MLLCSFPQLRADVTDDALTTNYPTNYPRRLHWEGKVKGKMVTMDIEAGAFVPSEHRFKMVSDQGQLIDGYLSYAGIWFPDTKSKTALKFPNFIIKDWKIRWDSKALHLPRGVYTSIFTPKLTIAPLRSPLPPDEDFVGVDVGTTDNENALVVSIHCGYDAVTYVVTFIITKTGQVYRFCSGASS